MSTINKLNAVDALNAGDLFVVFATQNGDSRKVAVSVLQTYVEDNLTLDFRANFETQYATPSATGLHVQITDSSADTHLIMQPAAAYATGTITLPQTTNAVDKQEVLVNSTDAVTTLTIDGNGGTVIGGPTTLAANDYFRLKYDLPSTTWYRVG